MERLLTTRGLQPSKVSLRDYFLKGLTCIASTADDDYSCDYELLGERKHTIGFQMTSFRPRCTYKSYNACEIKHGQY